MQQLVLQLVRDLNVLVSDAPSNQFESQKLYNRLIPIAVCQVAGCTANSRCAQSVDGHSAVCECHDGYHGLRCEHENASITWWIVAVAVLGVLALIGVGAAIFFWR